MPKGSCLYTKEIRNNWLDENYYRKPFLYTAIPFGCTINDKVIGNEDSSCI